MKLFFLWRGDDYAGALAIARKALALAEATIEKHFVATGNEIEQLRIAALTAEGRARELDAQLKKVSSASREL